MTAFSQIIGQDQAIELLKSAISNQRLASAYLFSGPEGVGRYLTALEFTTLMLFGKQNTSVVHHKVVHQNHPDLLIVEPTYLHQGKLLTEAQAQAEGLKRKAQPQIRVEQVREIARFLARPPLEASRAVVIIRSAQTMAEAAANALLKTLEEPGKATIILIAPSAESLLPTLVSRCQRIPFFRLATHQMKEVLRQTGYEDILEEETIIAIAQGSPGEAMQARYYFQNISSSLLQQLEMLIDNQTESPLDNIERGLSLAKEISNTLDFSTQIWLLNYLEQFYWQKQLQHEISPKILSGLKQLEASRQNILRYVQPRLVWEVTLLQIIQTSASGSPDSRLIR